MRAGEVVDLLRGHYGGAPSKPAPGYLAAEVEAPDSTRRADALWLPLDGYNRGRIIGHEVKVTRSDLATELNDPMKAEAWAKFCDEWWLVVSHVDVLAGFTIPGGWGIMAPPSGRSKRLMTIVRPAPKRRPQDQATAYAKVLARIYYNGDDQGTRIRSLEQQLETSRGYEQNMRVQLNEAQRQLRLAGLGQVDQSIEARVRKIVQALGERHVADGEDWRVRHELGQTPVEDIVEALLNPARVRAAATDALWETQQQVRAIERAMKEPDLRDALKTLRKAAESLGTIAPER